VLQTVLTTGKQRRHCAEAADSLRRNFAYAEHSFVPFGIKPDELLPTIPAANKSGIDDSAGFGEAFVLGTRGNSDPLRLHAADTLVETFPKHFSNTCTEFAGRAASLASNGFRLRKHWSNQQQNRDWPAHVPPECDSDTEILIAARSNGYALR